MNKFDRVLSDEEITDVVNDGFDGDLFDLAERVEQAILAKLAEQEPVMYARTYYGEIDWDEACVTEKNDGTLMHATDMRREDFIRHGYAVIPLYAHPIPAIEQEPVAWTSAEIMSGPSFVDDDDYAVMYKTKSHLLDDFCGYPEATPVPLYAHPMPSVSQTINKAGCVSESGESDNQNNALPDGTFINEGTKHLERIKRYQKWRRGEDKTMDEAGIHPKEVGESLDWLITFTENHIADMRKKVPEEWRLINTHPNKQLKELLLFNKNKIQVGLLWGSKWVDVAYNRINPQPTHWLPLPNPPKEG